MVGGPGREIYPGFLLKICYSLPMRYRRSETVLKIIKSGRDFAFFIVLAVSFGLLLGFCVDKPGFTIEPFASEPEAAAELAYLAEYACYDEPVLPFSSDGCSASPDGAWVDCCVLHDIRYWCGGSPEDRVYADRELRECVAEKGFGEAHGLITELGVRVGGHPVFPFRFRWGYGWPYSFGYISDQKGSIIR